MYYTLIIKKEYSGEKWRVQNNTEFYPNQNSNSYFNFSDIKDVYLNSEKMDLLVGEHNRDLKELIDILLFV